MTQPTITRRSFVKSAAALGAACGLGVAVSDDLVNVDPAHADTGGDVKIVKTACRACIASCAVLAHVKNGRVIKIEGNPESPMSQGGLCAKGMAGIQALYHPNRNKYPMRRVGERGQNQWERITWDEAITEIATKLIEIDEKYGSECVAVSTGGGGNPHFSNVKRFGEAINTPNVWEPGCAQCYLPRMGASQLSNGMGKPNNLSFSDSNGWDYYFTDSPVDSLVLWGTDPSNSSVATGGRALAELRAREKGLKTVVIDPRMTMDAAKAEVWLPIRPGTDAALLMAWTKWIIDNKKYDEDFCTNWTNMPYLVNPETRLTLKPTECGLEGTDEDYVIWDPAQNKPVVLEYPMNEGVTPPLFGSYEIDGQAVPHGRPAAQGERRRVHAGESRRNLLARRGPDREGAGDLHDRPVRHHAGRAHRPIRAVAAVRARRPQPRVPHGQRAEARRHAAKLQSPARRAIRSPTRRASSRRRRCSSAWACRSTRACWTGTWRSFPRCSRP